MFLFICSSPPLQNRAPNTYSFKPDTTWIKLQKCSLTNFFLVKKDTCYRSLELLQTDIAWYDSCVSGSFPGKQTHFTMQLIDQRFSRSNYNHTNYSHFDITRFLVVTERTGELGVQVARHFFLRRWLSLWFSAPHFISVRENMQAYFSS